MADFVLPLARMTEDQLIIRAAEVAFFTQLFKTEPDHNQKRIVEFDICELLPLRSYAFKVPQDKITTKMEKLCEELLPNKQRIELILTKQFTADPELVERKMGPGPNPFTLYLKSRGIRNWDKAREICNETMIQHQADFKSGKLITPKMVFNQQLACWEEEQEITEVAC